MTLETIRNSIRVFDEYKQSVHSFFISYRPSQNIITNEHGSIDKFESVLAHIGEIMNAEPIKTEVPPIRELVLYTKSTAIVFYENSYYSPLEDPEDESHIEISVPYVREGDFVW